MGFTSFEVDDLTVSFALKWHGYRFEVITAFFCLAKLVAQLSFPPKQSGSFWVVMARALIPTTLATNDFWQNFIPIRFLNYRNVSIFLYDSLPTKNLALRNTFCTNRVNLGCGKKGQIFVRMW